MYDTITLPSQLCGFEQSDLPENAALYKNKLEIPDPYNYKYPGSLSKKY